MPGDNIILHMCTINDNHMIYGYEIRSVTDRIFWHFWTVFCPFSPKNPKKQNFEKIKTTTGDIIILHMCTINDNHMMYGS